jgi:hypothetical protein
MIAKNIVLIETIDGIGTGLLYPCDIREKIDKENKKKNGYLIITNKHVLGYEFKTRNDENMTAYYMKHIHFTFYDDFEHRIMENEIEKIDIFGNEIYTDNINANDIVAIFIILKKNIVLTLSKFIYSKPLENRAELYMEGYPGVLFEEEINQRIQLKGMEKTLFPINKKLGAYQIVDDYHWYNNLDDKFLLEGLSGSPVFANIDGEIMIIGINQSVANTDNGKNPFKIVYYIRIEYILNYLRKAGCLIYRKISEYEYKLEWIYNDQLHKNKNTGQKDDGNNITLLLIGGSGAGKSSITKDFAYNASYIDSINDGQTTRTNVIYEYFLMDENPSATIKFLNEQNFISRMKKNVGTYPARFLIKSAFKLEKESILDEKKLLANAHHVLMAIANYINITKKNNGIKKLNDIMSRIMEVLKENYDNGDLLSLYEDIVEELIKWIPEFIIKCVIDANWIEKKIKENEILSENVNINNTYDGKRR